MFKLVSKFKPSGDQPEAIKELVEGIKDGKKEQVLLGATGTGKTFTIANVIAAPFWSTIEKQEPAERERLTYLRNAFASLLVTGPFSILVGFEGGLMALNDRLKLRSMVVGEKNETVYIASEECAVRVIEPELDRIWAPRGGEPVIVRLNEGGNQ